MASKGGMSKFSFWLFLLAAFLFLATALIGQLGWDAMNNFLKYIQAVVMALLFIPVGVLGWNFCKGKDVLYKILYIFCALVVIAAVIVTIL